MHRTRAILGPMLALAAAGVSGPGIAAPAEPMVPAVVKGTDTLLSIGDVTDFHRWDASDERLDGDVRYVTNPLWIEGLGLVVASISIALDKDGRGWTGEATGLTMPSGTQAAGPALRGGYTAILTGYGAYEGLTAYLAIGDASQDRASFEGVIFEGTMPAPPAY